MLKKIKKKLEYVFLKLIKPEIIGNKKINGLKVGEHSGISNFSHISSYGKNLFLGKNVFIGHFNYIDAHNSKIYIEDCVQITNYVNILTHSSNNKIRFPNSKFNKTLEKIGDVKIGAYSFIGPNSVIMPNSSIGKNSVVGAFSFVDGVFPDYSIIRGVPAKVIGDTRKIDEEFIKNNPEFKDYHCDSNKAQ
ncbi:acyltransferase [Flavobacteriales bacterium]|jgi:acetyltransferase-like isoleucine patch superfamily enzyme|nr:acyltransferase [Flavobacteriales bacterium]